MRVGSLFAGIGGFDLAAESLGWSTAWVSEIDPFASAVLAKHFPDARNLGDVTVIDWAQVEPVDVLCAGFPCQPHSLAGKRQASEDERDLWSECVRAVSLLRPRYFVGENVSGLLTSEGGRFFNRVVSDLAALGYAVEWGTLSAAECGAPHQRSRIFIVASLGDAERAERRALAPGRDECDGRYAGWEEASGGVGPRSRNVGDPLDARLEGHGGGRDLEGGRDESGRIAAHQARPTASANPRVRLPDWSDAIPYRGADGTVRLVPRGAVDNADGHGTERAGREEQGADAGRGSVLPAGAVANRGHSEPSRAGGESQPTGAEYAGGADGDGVRRRQEEVSRPESEVRPLAHGLPDVVARRDSGREVEAWSTPQAHDAGLGNAERVGRFGTEHGGRNLNDEAAAFAHGGSLWPVTESEPGRVAKLRAVGNAVVPRWVVEGPFRRILELESLTPTRGPDHG